jgi:thiamine kinase-like enzyme
VQPEKIAARVWPGTPLDLEALGGGITNRNFKVSVGGEAFVLRIGGKDTELLGIDRSVEHGASLVAAELGIGPEVVAFLEPEGFLVTRFLDGSPIPPEEMRIPANIVRAAKTLRRLHEGPPIPGRFDSFRVVEVYRNTASAHGVRIPEVFDWAQGLAQEIERARGSQALRPCHNDLLNANFIDEDGELRIVDWEYAGMGDRFFDLANFSINHDFGEDENECLLEAYFGAVDAADLATLTLMRFMSDFREAMWGVVQQGISELDFDFVDYAKQHFQRLRRTAPQLDTRLSAAGQSQRPSERTRRKR